MYGSYSLYDFSISHTNFTVKVERKGGLHVYIRECENEKVEKAILADDGQIIINPVEPVNKPVEITSYLQIEFTKPIVVEPEGKRRVYVKFPVEIGVFVAGRKSIRVVDIFTTTKPKYTLYGILREMG